MPDTPSARLRALDEGMTDHLPHVRDDQDSPYWSIWCSCGWRSGACSVLDAAVESYGEHVANVVNLRNALPALIEAVDRLEIIAGCAGNVTDDDGREIPGRPAVHPAIRAMAALALDALLAALPATEEE